MTTATRAARSHFPEVCHIEALIAEHRKSAPGVFAPLEQFETWDARRADLSDALGEATFRMRDAVCRKCDGTGRTQWKHRAGGVCFSCGGDGWSARGRRSVRPTP